MKPSGLRPFVLDDATGAAPPTTGPTEQTVVSERSARDLDERVRRWREERARFERHRRELEAAEARQRAPTETSGDPSSSG